jgi:hypothetical protein
MSERDWDWTAAVKQKVIRSSKRNILDFIRKWNLLRNEVKK